MSRRFAFICLVTILLATSLAAQDFDAVEIEATHVAGGIHMLEGAGGNIGVSVGEDGILIIDDQFAPLADKIRAALGKLGEGKLRFVLNTHWHGDHVGGNPVFGGEATIVAHDNVRQRLSTRQEMRGRVTEPMERVGLPTITFDDDLTIHFNDETIRVVHFPAAHTDGDSVVFFTGSNVVHMGDTMFSGRFPFVDHASGGSVLGLIEMVGKLLAEIPGNARIIPGHGPLSDVDDLKAYHEMLSTTLAPVEKAVAEGKSLDEIKEAGVPEKWRDYDWRFISADRWLETLHTEVTGKHR